MKLLQNNWKIVLTNIKTAGEDGSVNCDHDNNYLFWEGIGIFNPSSPGVLSNAGKAIFEALYIRCDGGEKQIMQKLLLSYPPVIAMQQYLWGVANITVSQVLSTLKITGHWSYGVKGTLVHFLDLLNYVGIIKYQKSKQKIEILISPDVQPLPKNIFINPDRPYSNIVCVKKILGECNEYIYWLDKHFQKEGLEWIWAIADANKIKEVKILSLGLADSNLNATTKKEYKRFKKELCLKGIQAEWRIVDSKNIKDTHDRWIIGGKKYLKNVPNVNAISSGQRSEITSSDNHKEVLSAFNAYWANGEEIQ